MPARTLYVIDGYAQFFRAYHAIRGGMTSPVTKEPTNATFGFVGMLLKLLRTCRPDYLAVALDVSGDRGTFRSELYPAYKATRDEPPEDLGPQVDRCVSLLREIGVPVLGAEGFEADDVIATLASRLVGETDLLVRIVSKDKDLEQLLRAGRVEMYDVHTGELVDEALLLDRKGLSPGVVIDALALMGDASDNVPGVPGIGPKTAAQLVREHGSAESVLEAARRGVIKGKRGERLLASAEQLPLAKRLVTLRDDAPVSLDLDEALCERFDLARLEPVLGELGFNRFREELRELLGTSEAGDPAAIGRGAAPADAPAAVGVGPGGLFEQASSGAEVEAGAYSCVRTQAELDEVVRSMRSAEMVSIDTETTSVRAMGAVLCGVSVAVEAGAGWYVPVRSPELGSHLDEGAVLASLAPVLTDPAVPKCGHNLKYDMIVLRRHGVALRGVRFDSMVASYVLDASRSSHSLDALALALLGRRCVPISDLIGTGRNQITFDRVPLGAATPYAAEDADVALQLRAAMAPELERSGLSALFGDVEMPLVEVLAELEFNGVAVDRAELARQRSRLGERIDALRGEIVDASPHDFNPDSPKQLAAVLFNKPGDEPPGLGLPPGKRTKTGYSTDVEVLEKLAGDPATQTPVPALVLEHRRLSKLVGTYLTALDADIDASTGRVHASFNQTVAATGRLSSSDPNLQNIPVRTEIGREIRRAFVAPTGRVLVGADYSQIELRVLAHLSGDEALIEAFRAGEDIHTSVAARVHGVDAGDVTRQQRDGAKMINFGIVYGITPFGLARRLGVSQGEAATIIEEYNARFPGIAAFLAECVAQARTNGWVETVLKRRRPISEIDSRQPQRRALAERMAINSVVQGSAADIIKLAMLDLHARLSPAASRRSEAEESPAPGTLMLLQIHDELVFETDAASAEVLRRLVVDRMQAAMRLRVPLVASSFVGESWLEAK